MILIDDGREQGSGDFCAMERELSSAPIKRSSAVAASILQWTVQSNPISVEVCSWRDLSLLRNRAVNQSMNSTLINCNRRDLWKPALRVTVLLKLFLNISIANRYGRRAQVIYLGVTRTEINPLSCTQVFDVKPRNPRGFVVSSRRREKRAQHGQDQSSRLTNQHGPLEMGDSVHLLASHFVNGHEENLVWSPRITEIKIRHVALP
jgi:hypothetical protein